MPALEEIELALSQRNTIPNASAVVFRKGAHLDCRADLEQMRLAGDWLFYATQIRGGRIAFVADALNAHRHHDQTVRHAFERTEALVEEQLHVKARIFESYPLSPNAIARSVGYTVAEYVRRKTIMGLDRPALASQPKLEPSLGRIRSALRARREPARDLRVLIVLSGADQGRGQEAAIRLANDIAAYFHVFVCNARPWIMDLRTAAELEDRITLIEGTLGMTFWVGDRETRGRDPFRGGLEAAVGSHRRTDPTLPDRRHPFARLVGGPPRRRGQARSIDPLVHRPLLFRGLPRGGRTRPRLPQPRPDFAVVDPGRLLCPARRSGGPSGDLEGPARRSRADLRRLRPRRDASGWRPGGEAGHPVRPRRQVDLGSLPGGRRSPGIARSRWAHDPPDRLNRQEPYDRTHLANRGMPNDPHLVSTFGRLNRTSNDYLRMTNDQ